MTARADRLGDGIGIERNPLLAKADAELAPRRLPSGLFVAAERFAEAEVRVHERQLRQTVSLRVAGVGKKYAGAFEVEGKREIVRMARHGGRQEAAVRGLPTREET
jgi:hypothetical protein